MTNEEKREQVIRDITGMLRSTNFTFEFKVRKKPKGIRVIYEVTQEQMNAIMESAEKEDKEG